MTEYLLTISVIVTFVVASSYFGFIPTMSQGVKAWGTQYETYYAKPGGPGN